LKDKYREDLMDFVMSRNSRKFKEHTLFTYYSDARKRIVVLKAKTAETTYHRLSKEMCIHIQSQRFRDSYVTHLISKGVKPSTVSKWVGHKDVSTTLHFYAKLTAKDEMEELEKI
jgi:integrase